MTKRNRIAIALTAVFALCLGCATGTPAIWQVQPAEQISVGERQASPLADGLLARVYRGDGHPDGLYLELTSALTGAPGDHRLHEAAGYLAGLRGDVRGVWSHFLRAAADRRAPPELRALYLEEALAPSLTVSEAKATIRVLNEIVSAEGPSVAGAKGEGPVLAARARDHRATLLARHGRTDRAAADVAALGFLSPLFVAGSFDNDQGKGFYTRFPPEDAVELDAEMEGLLIPVRWREVPLRDAMGRVRLDAVVAPGTEAVAYLAAFVKVPADVEVDVRVTTTDAVRVSVNGTNVAGAQRVNHTSLDNVSGRASLRRGVNILLIKSAQRDGTWRVGVRLTTTTGAAVPGLEVVKSPLGAVKPGGGVMKEPALMPPWIAAIEDTARKAFLASREAALRGDGQGTLAPLLPLGDAHPRSGLVSLHKARALRGIGEDGRALDLIHLAAKDGVAGALDERAAFYMDKRRYDKAQKDLEAALEKFPDARRARLRLAQVFENRGFHVDRCRVLEDARARWPDHGWPIRDHARCLRSRGYRDLAEAALLDAVRLEPGHRFGLEQLAEDASRRGDEALAVQRYEALAALDKSDLGARFARGEKLRLLGQRAEARAIFESLTALNPAWAPPHQRLGLIAYEDGQTESAVVHFRAALDRNPDDTRLSDLVDMLAPEGLGLAERYVPDEQAIDAVVAGVSKVRALPGAQVIYLLDHEVTEVRADGGARRVVTQVALATNTDGRDQLIKTRVPSGRVKLLLAYAVRPDGERQEAASIRSGVVRFRGLEAGSITVLQYVHYARPRGFLPTHFFAEWYFQGIHTQYQRSQWVVILPEGRELAVSATGPMNERRESVEGRTVRFFETEAATPFIPEPFMPPAQDLLRKVSVTTLTSWDEYVRWERALLDEVFRQDPEVQALAKKLTEGAKTARERFDRLFHYVAQEIRYQQDYEDTIAGVRPHACPVVLARGYGDCKDKAVLLILLAREVGIDVDFAILRTRDAGQVVRAIPNQQFNHAIVYVPKQAGIEAGFFLDPTVDALDKGNLRADDQGTWSLVLDPPTGKYEFLRIPYSAPEREYQHYRVELDVGKVGASAKTSLSVRGAFASQLRRLMRNPERATKFHQGVAGRLLVGGRVTGVEVSDINDTDQPLNIRHQMDATRAIIPAGEERRVKLPGAFMFPLRQAAVLDERTHPLSFGPPDSLHFDMLIKLPEGAKITHVPEPLSVEHACFKLTRETVKKPREVSVSVRYQRTCTEIAPADYGVFRDAVQQAARDIDGDVRFLPPDASTLAMGSDGQL